MAFKPAPLNTTFLVAGILGFLISVFYVWKYSASWGFALSIFFIILFLASVISMTRAPVEEQLLPRPEVKPLHQNKKKTIGKKSKKKGTKRKAKKKKH